MNLQYIQHQLGRYIRGQKLYRAYILLSMSVTVLTWLFLLFMGVSLGVLPTSLPNFCQIVFTSSVCKVEELATKHVPHDRDILHKHNLHTHTRTILQTTDKDLVSALHGNGDKIILRWTRFYGKNWQVPTGKDIFHNLKCPETRCVISDDKSYVSDSDAVIVHMRDFPDPATMSKHRLPHQRWIFYTLESPYHMGLNLSKYDGFFNWTSTYTSDSDLPSPYGVYKPFKFPTVGNYTTLPLQDFSRGKTRMAAWFVTNCKAQNSREKYVKALQKHIPVDIYGVCGEHQCRDKTMCFDMLRKRYKFYMAFENSNCREYITEKFWLNSLSHDVIPIVMGAPREDYEKFAPPKSFIHVDDFGSPHELARYLKILSSDRHLFNEYFRWRYQGDMHVEVDLEPKESHFWCNLCSALHNTSLPVQSHDNLAAWWSTDEQCFMS